MLDHENTPKKDPTDWFFDLWRAGIVARSAGEAASTAISDGILKAANGGVLPAVEEKPWPFCYAGWAILPRCLYGVVVIYYLDMILEFNFNLGHLYLSLLWCCVIAWIPYIPNKFTVGCIVALILLGYPSDRSMTPSNTPGYPTCFTAGCNG